MEKGKGANMGRACSEGDRESRVDGGTVEAPYMRVHVGESLQGRKAISYLLLIT